MFTRRPFEVTFYLCVTLVAGAGMCSLAFFLGQKDFWPQFMLSIGTSSLSIAAGLYILNVYIQGNTQRSALRGFLVWTYPVFRDWNHLVKDAFWAEFGRVEWDRLQQGFVAAHYDVTTLPNETIRRMMAVLLATERHHRNLFNDMEKFLREMEFLFGWSFDHIVLEITFLTRSDFRLVKGCDFSDPRHFSAICKGYLSADIHSIELMRRLFRILHVDFDASDRFPLDVLDIIGSV